MEQGQMLKRKKYLAYTTTLAEVLDTVKKDNTSRYEIPLYEYTPEHSDLTLDEKDKQRRSYAASCLTDIRISQSRMEEIVKDIIVDILTSKYRDDMNSKVIDTIMHKKIEIWVSPIQAVGDLQRLDTIVYFGKHLAVGYYNVGEKDFDEEIRDDKKTKQLFDTIKIPASYAQKENGYVYLYEFGVRYYKYRVDWIESDIPKIVKKILKNKFAYCFRDGKSIVPDEYLDKGAAGIDEWRTLKASKNKNNSIEKKILRDIVKNKKNYAYSCTETITRVISTSTYDWTIPSLIVEGRFNAGKVSKLTTQILKNAGINDMFKATEKQIFDAIQEYWKRVLKKAYDDLCTQQAQ